MGNVTPGDGIEELTFITTPGFLDSKYLDAFKSYAGEKDKQLKIIKGDMCLIENLINGKWDEEDFLIVPPCKTISAIYDHKTVMSAE